MASRAIRGASMISVAFVVSGRLLIVLRSAPPMNARVPAAVNTATRTSRSSLNARKVSRISRNVSVSTAFTGGRSSVTVAMWSFNSTEMSGTSIALPSSARSGRGSCREGGEAHALANLRAGQRRHGLRWLAARRYLFQQVGHDVRDLVRGRVHQRAGLGVGLGDAGDLADKLHGGGVDL